MYFRKVSRFNVFVFVGIMCLFLGLSGLLCEVYASEENPFVKPSLANIDWTQHRGEKITMMMCEHWYTDAIKPLISDFEKLTGISISMSVHSEDDFYKKLKLALAAGNVTPDVFMVGNLDIAQFAAAGWLEAIDSYLSNPRLTDRDWYDYDDVFSTVKKVGTFNGKQYIAGIPTAELEIMYYRTDIFTEAGIAVPETYDELYDIAKKLHTDEISGFVTRGARGISNWWEWTGIFLSYGGRFFDASGNPIFNSPQGIAATEMWRKLLKETGPRGVETFTWLMNVGYFRSGKSATCFEASGVTPLMIHPEESQIVGKIGYAQLPHVPGGKPVPNYWTWALGMNSNSRHKEASWLLLEWLSSKYITYKAALRGGAGGVRASLLATPAFEIAYGPEWTKVVTEGLAKYVEPKLVPYHMPEISEIVDEISIGLCNVLTGVETPKEALDNAAQRVREILQ